MLTPDQQAGVRVVVEPESCLHDEPVSVRVQGLQPGQQVTLSTTMTDTRNVKYLSYAQYTADEDGVVDVEKMASHGGRYEGVFPMGLIGMLQPAPGEYKYTRLFKRDVQNPNVVSVSVHPGHQSAEELCGGDGGSPQLSAPPPLPLASTTHYRHYMGPGVQRIPVRYGKVRGCLFLPKGPGPFPGVVDMFGTAGGLLEYRSAQLASRGFASLALAFFGYDDLPKYLEEFDISYFEEAVEFLLKHEKIVKPHVGAVGVSKGGDLVLSLATFIPEVKAGVWINGCNANVSSKLHLHDRTIPGLPFDLQKIKMIDNVMDCYETVENPKNYPETIIPIEEADANFLFLVGCADRNWKSVMYADQAVERLKQAGRNNYEVYKYEEAGHLLEPPYSAMCTASFHKIIDSAMFFGGTAQPHIEAEIHAWHTTLKFLNEKLLVCKGKL